MIRWTAKQKALLKKTVESFNRKVRSLQKSLSSADVKKLPKTIKQADLKKSIGTGKDLRDIAKIYERFTKSPKVEFTAQATKWAESEAAKLQRKRNREVAKMRLQHGYDPLQGNTQRFIDEGISFTNLNVKKLTARMLDKYIGTQIKQTTQGGKQAKIAQYQRNMLKRIDTMPNITNLQRKQMKYLIKKLTPEQLMDLHYNSDSLNIGFLYPAPGEEYEAAAMFIEEMEYRIDEWNKQASVSKDVIKYVKYIKCRF